MLIIEGVLKDYIEGHELLKMSMFTTQEKTDFNNKMVIWVRSMKGKSWRDAWNIITSSCNSWDNYSLTMMYLMEFDISGLSKIAQNQTDGFLNVYIENLKKIIISLPNERSLPENTLSELTTIFSKINKKEHTQRVEELSILHKDAGNVEKMRKIRTIKEVDGIQKKDFLYRKEPPGIKQ